jgi:nitrous oxide reductase accessory protein NosL
MVGQSATLAEMKQTFLLLALLLASCHQEEKPEAPTPAEAERLNDAEAMLNGLANEEGPENAAAPSDPSINSD